MPVVRVDNYRDAYRLRAQGEDIHELAARPNKRALTEFVNRRIMDALELVSDDVLVDVGCGDASLLRMAAGRTSKSIGIVATIEEKLRLESSFPDLCVIASDAQKLPLESGIASKIVCNTTLLYLPSESDVRASLREMSRIARPGATIWVGEIPEIDEYAYYGMYRGTSMPAFLWHLLINNGLRSFFGMGRRWLMALTGSEQIVLNSAGMFYAGPEKMVELAQVCGLHLRSQLKHKELDEQGNMVDSMFRYDYTFTI
jgi:hypothetical protein